MLLVSELQQIHKTDLYKVRRYTLFLHHETSESNSLADTIVYHRYKIIAVMPGQQFADESNHLHALPIQ